MLSLMIAAPALLGLMFLSLGGQADPAPLPDEDDDTGENPTDVGATSGDDLITGTNGADLIRGLSGDDTISALSGDDVIDGNAVHDAFLAGAGDDVARGGAGPASSSATASVRPMPPARQTAGASAKSAARNTVGLIAAISAAWAGRASAAAAMTTGMAFMISAFHSRFRRRA